MAKADPTLVKAAFSEATSRAGADVLNMKPLYDATTAISQGYLKQITNIMKGYKEEKEKERIALEKQLEPFQKIADETLVKLFSNQEAMPDKIINAFENRIRQLQDEFELVNTLGDEDTTENRRARMKLMGELNKISQQTINLRKTTMDFADRIANGQLNTSLVESELVDPAKMVLDFKNMDDNDNIIVGYDKDGIMFTVKDYWYSGEGVDSSGKVIPASTWGDPISFNIKDLDEAFPGIDTEIDSEVLKMTNATGKKAIFDASGTNAQYSYDKNAQRGFFVSKIKDKKAFQNIATRRLDGIDVPSFKEALVSNIAIPTSVLSNMFIDENGERIEIGKMLMDMDYNNDGFITEQDGVLLRGVEMADFNTNVDIMIDALTNIHNPLFDLKTSRELLTDYYVGGDNRVGIDEQVYNKNFDIEIKKKQNNNRGSGSETVFKGSYDADGIWRTKEYQDMLIDDVLAGNREIVHKGITWVPDGNGNYSATAEQWNPSTREYESVSRKMSGHDLLYKQFGFQERMRGKYKNDFDFSGTVDNTYSGQPRTHVHGRSDVILESFEKSQFQGPDGRVNVRELPGRSAAEIVGILQHNYGLKSELSKKNKNQPKKIQIYEQDGYIVFRVAGMPTRAFENNKEGIELIIDYINGDEWKNAFYPA